MTKCKKKAYETKCKKKLCEANYKIKALKKRGITSPKTTNRKRNCCKEQPCIPPVFTPPCVAPVQELIVTPLFPSQTQAIYHGFLNDEPSGTKILEVIKDFQIGIKCIVPGTELYPGAPVYGYECDHFTLDLNGGRKKSYNKEFKKFLLRYHGARLGESVTFDDGSEVVMVSNGPKQVHDNYKAIVSFFAQRGFPLQAGDKPSVYDGYFVSSWSSGFFFGPNLKKILMKFLFASECDSTPIALDFLTTNANGGLFDPLEIDPSAYENFHSYPMRIPITTDYCGEFQNSTGPIAFYDCSTQAITIRIPENDIGYYYGFGYLQFPTFNPPVNIDQKWYTLAFDGTFRLLKRNKQNLLVPSSPRDIDVMVQSSPTITIVSRTVNNASTPNPVNVDLVEVIDLNSPDWPYYVGITMVKYNGGSNAFDCYNLEGGLNAITLEEDTFTLINNENQQGVPFPDGDNTSSSVVEKLSQPRSITAYVNEDWPSISLQFDPIFLAGQTYPEQIATLPAPVTASYTDLWQATFAHEFAHACQSASGSIGIPGAEALSVSIEMDPRITPNVIFMFRPVRWIEAAQSIYDGLFGPVRLSRQGPNHGVSMFWNYMQRYFDYNHQVNRRTMDILGTVTWGPLAVANGIPYAFITPLNNNTGGDLALAQALQEIHGKDLRDVWTDFSIASALIRDNTSIPEQYRLTFPYWIFQSAYPGRPQIEAGLTVLGQAVTFASWWDYFNTNAVTPLNWIGTPHRGAVFTRILPANVTRSLQAFRSLVYVVPSTYTTITATAVTGEWRVALVQFTSDGTQVGTFKQAGPFTINGGDPARVFNIPSYGFTPTGIIKLVAVQVKVQSLGGLNDYYSVEPIPGSITIVSI